MARNLVRTRWLASIAFTASCLFVVAAISVHDAMLLILNDQVILEFEQNPIGRWLIERGGGEVWLFVALKLAGTTTVCTVISVLVPRWPQTSATIAGSLASIQVALLVYLTV
jgi:hypothetical protein